MRTLVVVASALVLAGCTGPADGPRASAPPVATQAQPTASSPTVGLPYPDWPTYHGDAARTGVSVTMQPARGAPRLVASLKLDGAVYASPLVVAGTTIVATENDSVYALTGSGRQLWRTHLGTPSPAGERPCGNIDPLGITGTPAYDAGTRTVFAVAEYGGPPRHELVALDARTGVLRWRASVDLAGTDAVAMQERGALTITGGRVWVPFGGLDGDCGNYKGRVIGVPLGGSGPTVSYTVPTSREAGIWAPPGPNVDATGRLFVSVGNGAARADDPYDHSDSVLELDSGARLVDSFSPATWAADNAADADLGSEGPALVGDWIFIAGKSGTAYVLRKNALGGIGGQVSSAPICTSFGGTAVRADVVYVPCTDGVRAVRVDAAGHMQVLWHAAGAVTGSPVVGGGRIWTLDVMAGVLHGLDPATGRSSGSVQVGTVTRFATPALYGSHVLVPTVEGLAIVASS
jgi:hypothetical protein